MLKDWISAARPRTLPVSAGPVIAATAFAWHNQNFRWVPALLCLMFALLAQIASNLANDYFDFKKGSDKIGRVGPRRAVVSGDISPRAMLSATLITLGTACLFGCGLIWYTGWWLIPAGILIALFALAYTAGPYPLSYHGLGDITVFVFFGLVAVNLTYYVQALTFDMDVFLSSIAIGLLSVNVLIVNNYRDMEDDKDAHKKTTVVLFGRKTMGIIYLLNGLFAVILTWPVWKLSTIFPVLVPFLFMVLHYASWRALLQLKGRELNKVLGRTARNLLIFTLLITITLICF
ncbi:1,4-dihydroxy-2-naphthoate polyprenyltransferase [Barnesiella propionica]|uniref:1,4-dihydroxy-2-naphthoate polyprenyltransferase n=1 Tax=Barnesiella propionica TaxID=2981781 RepID=UPI0011C84C48|nr:1,4-dihydroxy-2-naphthoate polyprenyltransferase [Barnesiella propionica]MCU6768282.1 1,4-dihydroxy-2-naphthoate polyprenyltransferase [Barnesiella propionica]